ncbi:hypothetical protein E0E52_05310 [Azotobacter chroococcum]|nr:hypothetical protein [Azotobacter chroococcum]TBW09902.1 hypothetical protein E0E52_05310 [Azotobacter chroococcum]
MHITSSICGATTLQCGMAGLFRSQEASLARLPYENGLANKFSSAKLTLTYPAQNYDSHSFMAGKVQKQQETATNQACDEYRPQS